VSSLNQWDGTSALQIGVLPTQFRLRFAIGDERRRPRVPAGHAVLTVDLPTPAGLAGVNGRVWADRLTVSTVLNRRENAIAVEALPEAPERFLKGLAEQEGFFAGCIH